MKINEDTMPLHVAIGSVALQAGFTEPGPEALAAFMKNTRDCARVVGDLANMLGTLDDAVETCVFRQIAKAAITISIALEQGQRVNGVMNGYVDRCNAVQKERLKGFMDEGGEPIITTVTLTDTEVVVVEDDNLKQ
jgi:hypothetical protein